MNKSPIPLSESESGINISIRKLLKDVINDNKINDVINFINNSDKSIMELPIDNDQYEMSSFLRQYLLNEKDIKLFHKNYDYNQFFYYLLKSVYEGECYISNILNLLENSNYNKYVIYYSLLIVEESDFIKHNKLNINKYQIMDSHFKLFKNLNKKNILNEFINIYNILYNNDDFDSEIEIINPLLSLNNDVNAFIFLNGLSYFKRDKETLIRSFIKNKNFKVFEFIVSNMYLLSEFKELLVSKVLEWNDYKYYKLMQTNLIKLDKFQNIR